MADRSIILEVSQLNDISPHGENDEFTVAILSWLALQLPLVLKDQLGDVSFDVVKVINKGLSAYPVLAIYSESMEYFDAQYKLVETTCETLLHEKPMMEIVQFIAESKKDWTTISANIME